MRLIGNLKFIVDNNVGKLAKWLRIMGYDTLLFNNSDDSRNGWTLPHQNIVGKAWLSIWPRARWGLAPNYPLQEQIDSFTSNE